MWRQESYGAAFDRSSHSKILNFTVSSTVTVCNQEESCIRVYIERFQNPTTPVYPQIVVPILLRNHPAEYALNAVPKHRRSLWAMLDNRKKKAMTYHSTSSCALLNLLCGLPSDLIIPFAMSFPIHSRHPTQFLNKIPNPCYKFRHTTRS